MILERIPSKKLTRREAFEHVSDHLLTQGCRSDDAGLCLYRHRPQADGPMLACAVGCLMPDELYDPKFEHRGPERPDVLRSLEPVLQGIDVVLRENTDPDGEFIHLPSCIRFPDRAVTNRRIGADCQHRQPLIDTRDQQVADGWMMLKMLCHLQKMHDDIEPSEWEAYLEDIRELYVSD